MTAPRVAPQRYVILVWTGSDTHQSAGARLIARLLQSTWRGWRCVVDCTGLILFHAGGHSGGTDCCALAGVGAVIGPLFDREMHPHGKSATARLDQEEVTRVLATGGRRLLERYWGRYVAVIHDERAGSVRVLRDPSGGLPCFLTRYHGVLVFFSDVEDLLRLELFKFSVDWQHIARTVALSVAHVRSTGLIEVSEVQAGECVEVGADSVKRSQLWNPSTIAKSDPIQEPDEGATALASTVAGCVHAWASRHESIVHNVSGGLDSTIVLTCLARAKPHPGITCLNYFSSDPEADERRYARLAAHAARCHLIEHELDARAVRLERMLGITRSVKPWFYLYDLEHGQFEAQLAAQHGATALFSGAGGDSVFYQGRAGLAARDFAFEHGFRAGLIAVAHDAARIERTTVWRILAGALRPQARDRAWRSFAELARSRTLVHSDLLHAVRRDPEAVHPWLQLADEDVPPGKLWHMLSMGTPMAYYDAFGRLDAPERILPLMSQPVVELCLRIPTYVHIDGGRDRGIARRAFARELPAEIVGRRGKGGSDLHIRRVLDANLEFVRALLLDGALVSRRILDRARLESYLADRTQEGPAYNEIVQDYISIEAWIARWSSTSAAATAG